MQRQGYPSQSAAGSGVGESRQLTRRPSDSGALTTWKPSASAERTIVFIVFDAMTSSSVRLLLRRTLTSTSNPLFRYSRIWFSFFSLSSWSSRVRKRICFVVLDRRRTEFGGRAAFWIQQRALQ